MRSDDVGFAGGSTRYGSTDNDDDDCRSSGGRRRGGGGGNLSERFLHSQQSATPAVLASVVANSGVAVDEESATANATATANCNDKLEVEFQGFLCRAQKYLVVAQCAFYALDFLLRASTEVWLNVRLSHTNVSYWLNLGLSCAEIPRAFTNLSLIHI